MAEKGNENLMGAASYLLGFITGLVFLLIGKENKFVRFHAMQSVVCLAAYLSSTWRLDSSRSWGG